MTDEQRRKHEAVKAKFPAKRTREERLAQLVDDYLTVAENETAKAKRGTGNSVEAGRCVQMAQELVARQTSGKTSTTPTIITIQEAPVDDAGAAQAPDQALEAADARSARVH